MYTPDHVGTATPKAGDEKWVTVTRRTVEVRPKKTYASLNRAGVKEFRGCVHTPLPSCPFGCVGRTALVLTPSQASLRFLTEAFEEIGKDIGRQADLDREAFRPECFGAPEKPLSSEGRLRQIRDPRVNHLSAQKGWSVQATGTPRSSKKENLRPAVIRARRELGVSKDIHQAVSREVHAAREAKSFVLMNLLKHERTRAAHEVAERTKALSAEVARGATRNPVTKGVKLERARGWTSTPSKGTAPIPAGMLTIYKRGQSLIKTPKRVPKAHVEVHEHAQTDCEEARLARISRRDATLAKRNVAKAKMGRPLFSSHELREMSLTNLQLEAKVLTLCPFESS